jgi:acyl-CoA synthetase (NDP forming)
VALIVQSGNLGASLGYRFSRRGIGLSRMISSGNEADLTMEDYLELLERDEKTRLICLYIEGVREGPRFFETARRIGRTKPILLLKGGVTASGALAARSHTGAMAGNDVVFRHICRQAGIIQVETMDEMADTVGMFLSQPRPAGKRVGIVTLGGGWGVLAADLCEAVGLEVAPLSDRVVAMMDGFLPPFWSRRNPVDLVAPNGVAVIIDAVRVLIEHGGMDAVLMLGLGYSTIRAKRWLDSPIVPQADVEKQAGMMISEERILLDLLIEQIQQYRKPIIPVIDIVTFDEVMENNPVHYLERHGIMSYSAPDPAIRALANVTTYYARTEEPS